MPPVVIENPVINAPYDEPQRHFRFAEDGITDEVVEARRVSSYFIPYLHQNDVADSSLCPRNGPRSGFRRTYSSAVCASGSRSGDAVDTKGSRRSREG